MARSSKVEPINNTSNDAKDDIEIGIPYVVEVTIVGVAPLLFHRWSCDAVAEKAKAAKNSAAKKQDNIESSICSKQASFRLPSLHHSASRIGTTSIVGASQSNETGSLANGQRCELAGRRRSNCRC